MSYDNNNIFAKILRDEAPCIKVYEDDKTLAFMDIMPQMPGHTLVIPKEAAVTVHELSDDASLACMKTVQKVGKAVEQAMGVTGFTLFQLNGAEVGQTVPHFHFHILPGSILNATGIKGHAVEMGDQQELTKIADKIKRFLA
ncbi:HIT family protein [Thalassotalea euphylliae]|uniref:HIT family protein n=1 Tax=Thalassotalea euphylliae TaxID=1655234 RepID=A0A3E0UFM8_9GAMM|nr:HIT family protein [Thalassotalea euphylliae]REL35831.1 HIT family protein [Thalassotalea euphylliae]